MFFIHYKEFIYDNSGFNDSYSNLMEFVREYPQIGSDFFSDPQSLKKTNTAVSGKLLDKFNGLVVSRLSKRKLVDELKKAVFKEVDYIKALKNDLYQLINSDNTVNYAESKKYVNWNKKYFLNVVEIIMSEMPYENSELVLYGFSLDLDKIAEILKKIFKNANSENITNNEHLKLIQAFYFICVQMHDKEKNNTMKSSFDLVKLDEAMHIYFDLAKQQMPEKTVGIPTESLIQMLPFQKSIKVEIDTNLTELQELKTKYSRFIPK